MTFWIYLRPPFRLIATPGPSSAQGMAELLLHANHGPARHSSQARDAWARPCVSSPRERPRRAPAPAVTALPSTCCPRGTRRPRARPGSGAKVGPVTGTRGGSQTRQARGARGLPNLPGTGRHPDPRCSPLWAPRCAYMHPGTPRLALPGAHPPPHPRLSHPSSGGAQQRRPCAPLTWPGQRRTASRRRTPSPAGGVSAPPSCAAAGQGGVGRGGPGVTTPGGHGDPRPLVEPRCKASGLVTLLLICYYCFLSGSW